jgi:RNA polymerase sigma-70 factor, ECF subfamily
MSTNPDETRTLLDRVKNGDASAFEGLFKRHRSQLRRAIAMRIDRRVAARVDASDVLQETYMEGVKRLPNYELPIYAAIPEVCHKSASRDLLLPDRRG